MIECVNVRLLTSSHLIMTQTDKCVTTRAQVSHSDHIVQSQYPLYMYALVFCNTCTCMCDHMYYTHVVYTMYVSTVYNYYMYMYVCSNLLVYMYLCCRYMYIYYIFATSVHTCTCM